MDRVHGQVIHKQGQQLPVSPDHAVFAFDFNDMLCSLSPQPRGCFLQELQYTDRFHFRFFIPKTG